jgi:hypothetical protein
VISLRPAACAKTFRFHGFTVVQETGICNTVLTPYGGGLKAEG